jgi:hypothetical protein
MESGLSAESFQERVLESTLKLVLERVSMWILKSVAVFPSVAWRDALLASLEVVITDKRQ